MRSSSLCFGASILAGMANAACTPCGSVKCLGALAADPAVGESFCSSFLSLSPATATVTEVETVTTTQVAVETALTTVTAVRGTVTVTTGERTTLYQKRAPTISTLVEPAPTSSPDQEGEIVSKCSSNDARISKACNCFLSTAAGSTVTVTETATATAGVEATSTVVETVTTDAVATVSVAPPAYTVPANVIVNGGFENYATTQNISPWVVSTTSGNGRVEPIYPLSVCGPNGDCPGGQVIIRVWPPTSGSGYVSLTETFTGRPSTTYNVSFLYRCLNYDANTRIKILYNSVATGPDALCPNGNFNRATGFQFTTDSTGTGEIQIRFSNPSNLPYLYWYADDFKAIAA
ncbi:hypothetical protein QBC43DRAFT_344249 [Cladorrhinum sp. PSN259]|nr:hypothetical protein QBC43DRAFT_344249 [Cladorrhinum sp. PSN259]